MGTSLEIIGEILRKNGNSVYSPALPRVTDGGHFSYNLLQLGGTMTGSVSAVVEHRNRDEDTWTNAGSFLNAASTGVKLKSISSGLKEIARMKLTLNSGSSDAWARVAVLPPVWTSRAVIEGAPPLQMPIQSVPVIRLGKSFDGPTEKPACDGRPLPVPDAGIAVGNGFVVAVVNGQVAIYDKGGRHLGGPVELFPCTSIDPRCFFDHYARRFVIFAVQAYTNPQLVWIVVSSSSDPRGRWYTYHALPIQGIDYSGAGYDKTNYYFVAGGILFVWEKKFLLVGDYGSAYKSQTAHPNLINAQPAITLDNTAGRFEYIVSRPTFSRHLKIFAWDVGGKALNGPVTPSFTWIDPTGTPPSCHGVIRDELGKIGNAVFRNHRMYAAHVVTDHNRNQANLLRIHPNGWPTNPQATPLVANAILSSTPHVLFPSIGVNSAGTSGMVVATTKALTPPGMGIVGRTSLGRWTSLLNAKSGVCSNNTNQHWGDYTAIAVDPDDDSFWAFSEYWLPAQKWGMWIQQFFVQ